MNTKEDRTIYVKCPTCLARFTGEHTCDPLMKVLNEKPWLTKSGKVKSSWLKKNAKFSHGLTYPK